jgi:hypothetical protein
MPAASPHADVDHPDPRRERAPLWAQTLGLVAAPIAWGLQLVAGYGLSSHACFPAHAALGHVEPGWGGMRTACLILNLAAIAVCISAGAFSLKLWQATRSEARGAARATVAVGEGRTRFSSLCGALTSGAALLVVLFDTVVILGAPACRG